jgi:IS30 family transposase
LQDKSETQGTLKRFLRRAQNEFELKVKKIRSDNGSEFKNLQALFGRLVFITQWDLIHGWIE